MADESQREYVNPIPDYSLEDLLAVFESGIMDGLDSRQLRLDIGMEAVLTQTSRIAEQETGISISDALRKLIIDISRTHLVIGIRMAERKHGHESLPYLDPDTVKAMILNPDGSGAPEWSARVSLPEWKSILEADQE